MKRKRNIVQIVVTLSLPGHWSPAWAQRTARTHTWLMINERGSYHDSSDVKCLKTALYKPGVDLQAALDAQERFLARAEEYAARIERLFPVTDGAAMRIERLFPLTGGAAE